ncbi:hypothetical protein HY024_03120 [Candidatus Curtissbacteria bacterium]|nr:hypothetical protein [Candidatus Curtissbacteria bacterium]
MLRLARIATFTTSLLGSLSVASNVFADASSSAGIGGGQGTSSSLPNAGSTDLTYFIFIVGAMLFIFGMLKLVSSYRE